MSMTEVIVKGTAYCVPTEILNVAMVTFDQQYGRASGSVPALARRIAHELMPATREDPFSAERLTRCILSLKGRRGGRRKKRDSIPHQEQQLELF